MLARIFSWFRHKPLFSTEALHVIDALQPGQTLVLTSERPLRHYEREALVRLLQTMPFDVPAIVLDAGLSLVPGSAKQPAPANDPKKSEHAKDCSSDDPRGDRVGVLSQPAQGGVERSA